MAPHLIRVILARPIPSVKKKYLSVRPMLSDHCRKNLAHGGPTPAGLAIVAALAKDGGPSRCGGTEPAEHHTAATGGQRPIMNYERLRANSRNGFLTSQPTACSISAIVLGFVLTIEEAVENSTVR